MKLEDQMFISYLKDANDEAMTAVMFGEKWRSYEVLNRLIKRFKRDGKSRHGG